MSTSGFHVAESHHGRWPQAPTELLPGFSNLSTGVTQSRVQTIKLNGQEIGVNEDGSA